MISRFKLITVSQIVLLLLLCSAGHGVVLAEDPPRASLSLKNLFGKESSEDLVKRALEINKTDPAEARRLYTLAANQGYADAQNNLALMNYDGMGGEKNLKEARRLYTLAAIQGNTVAQYNLAVMNKNGEGG